VTDTQEFAPRSTLRLPMATPAQVAREAVPFPVKTSATPVETLFADWRRRLSRNLSRRSDGRWEPLTWVHAAEESQIPNQDIFMPSRRFEEHHDTPLWAAVEATITELSATREISVNTAPDYVIGHLCQELVAKKLIVSTGIQK
jgi:hypothetical protein